MKITSCHQGSTGQTGFVLSGYLIVPGRDQTGLYLWPDSGGGLQEGMACEAEKIREYSMEEDGVSGSEDVWEVCVIQESLQCLQEPFGIQNEPLPYSVVSALRDAEVLAEGRDGGELPGNPGIEKGYEESQAIGRIGNDDRGEQRVGATTGAALEGMDGYQMVANRTIYVTDELSGIGTVTAVSVSGSSTGGTAGNVREKGGLLLRQTGVYLKVIQVLYFMKSLAYVQK